MCARSAHAKKKGTIRQGAEAPSQKGCRGDTPSTLERKLILSVSGAHTNSLRHRRSGLSSVFSSGSCDYSQVDRPAHAHGCTHVGVREVIGFRTRTSYGNRFDHKAVRRSARSSRLERSHWSMNTAPVRRWRSARTSACHDPAKANHERFFHGHAENQTKSPKLRVWAMYCKQWVTRSGFDEAR